ncbi:MAG: Arylsulfatase precursor, partial [Verrucomicrobiota bacterium]
NYAAPRIVIGTDAETETVLTRQNWRVPDTGDNNREGTWLLLAERAATYDVELRWLKPMAPGTIEVRAGDSVRTVELHGAADRVSVTDIRIPPGEFAFTATHRAGKVSEGAYHATLVRR